MTININVKSSTGDKFSVDVETSITVADFKQLINEKSNIPPAQQRIIYSGHVLKDHQQLSEYNIKDGHTVHLVKSAAPAPPPPSSEQAPNANTQQAMPTLPGMPANVSQMMNNQMFQDALNSPLFQNIIDNPEMFRQMMMNNPEMQNVIRNNPEVAHVLNDPRMIRQSLEMMRNPELMREMMRNADRAMVNIENHPEGFNMLRRMYTDVQEPLINAAANQQQQQQQQQNNPFSSLFGQNAGANPAPSADTPLPNPWATPAAAPSAPQPTGTPAAAPTAGTNPTQQQSNPFSMFGGMGGMGGMGDMGGMENMLNNLDPAQLSAIMSNPAIQSMLSNPEAMRQMAESNPMLRQMLDANPMMRETLNRPDFWSRMSNPQNLQAMMQMQQAIETLRQNGFFGEGDPMSMLGGMGGMGGMNAFGGLGGFGAPSSTPAAAQSNVPPAERFRDQLQKLQEMGFPDQEENIRALTATNGNVNAAIERLLNS